MNHSPDNGAGSGGGKPPPPPPLQAALADAIGAFSKDPGGAARRLLDTADRALAGAGARNEARDAVARLATAASRFLSESRPPFGARGGAGPAEAPPGGAPEEAPSNARRDSADPAVPESAPAAAPRPTPFVELRQPGEGWSFHVRAAAVEAVAPADGDTCVLHLSDGSTMEAGQISDAVARLLPGVARLSRTGTQHGLYVRPGAVLAIAAPSGGGCVLRLRGGRELAAAEAAAVAAGLLAEGER